MSRQTKQAKQTKCPICDGSAEFFACYGGAGSSVVCPRCGEFGISNIAKQDISSWTQLQKVNLSGWIRENQKIEILSPSLEKLASLRSPSVGEKALKILSFLASTYPKPGETIASNIILSVEGLESAPADQSKVFVKYETLLGVSWSLDLKELEFLIYEYLVSEKNFLCQFQGSDLKITPKGWSHVDSLRQGDPKSKIGFIAMWFDESVNDTWLAIDKGIRAAGYESLRIDQKQHNNKIDDEIIAAIRRSKFVVADFTKQRGGVYFEAGFARGLNLEVIWLCRQDELKEVHFDTRQYNFIVWEQDKLGDLSKALKNRIEATIGYGPIAENICDVVSFPQFKLK